MHNVIKLLIRVLEEDVDDPVPANPQVKLVARVQFFPFLFEVKLNLLPLSLDRLLQQGLVVVSLERKLSLEVLFVDLCEFCGRSHVMATFLQDCGVSAQGLLKDGLALPDQPLDRPEHQLYFVGLLGLLEHLLALEIVEAVSDAATHLLFGVLLLLLDYLLILFVAETGQDMQLDRD